MQIDVDNLNRVVVAGLKSAWQRHFILTDQRDENIRPEYLTTAAICDAFSCFIVEEEFAGRLVVRSEEMTRRIESKSFLFEFFSRKNGRRGRPDSLIRKGNVDISLATRESGLESTFGVIENKGFLSFRQDGELYKGSRRELEKDLRRNAEFVGDSVGDSGIEYSAFTFYMRDSASVLKADSKKFCNAKKFYFESVAKELLGSSSHALLLVEVNTLDENLFCSDDEANEVSEDGSPSYVSAGTWHIAYGFVCIYRPKRILATGGFA